jgi:hypothetical protein
MFSQKYEMFHYFPQATGLGVLSTRSWHACSQTHVFVLVSAKEVVVERCDSESAREPKSCVCASCACPTAAASTSQCSLECCGGDECAELLRISREPLWLFPRSKSGQPRYIPYSISYSQRLLESPLHVDWTFYPLFCTPLFLIQSENLA